MRKVLFLAVLLAPALLAPCARAADPASVARVENYLRDDEKAFLAAILIHPRVSAEFDAGAPLAFKNPKNLKPFLGVWRAKMEAFAETDSRRPDPDLDGHYSSFAQMMTPEQRAYLRRRLPTLSERDRNSLIGYLNSVNSSLANGGTLGWYTKKVVSGIMDHYREDLISYVRSPLAQSAKRNAAASAAAFAAIQKAAAVPAKTAPAKAADVAATDPTKPAVKTAPTTKPSPSTKSAPAAKTGEATPPAPTTKTAATTPAATKSAPAAKTTAATSAAATKPARKEDAMTTTNPTGGALDQLKNTAGAAAEQGGQKFDGGSGAKAPVGAGATGVSAGDAKSGAAPTPPNDGDKPSLDASIPSVPSPVSEDDNYVDSIQKMRTKPTGPCGSGATAPIGGGALGALIGFLVGGPIGALIGIAVGAGGGALAGNALCSHLSQ